MNDKTKRQGKKGHTDNKKRQTDKEIKRQTEKTDVTNKHKAGQRKGWTWREIQKNR